MGRVSLIFLVDYGIVSRSTNLPFSEVYTSCQSFSGHNKGPNYELVHAASSQFLMASISSADSFSMISKRSSAVSSLLASLCWGTVGPVSSFWIRAAAAAALVSSWDLDLANRRAKRDAFFLLVASTTPSVLLDLLLAVSHSFLVLPPEKLGFSVNHIEMYY